MDATVFDFDAVSSFECDFVAGAFSDKDLATSGQIYKPGGPFAGDLAFRFGFTEGLAFFNEAVESSPEILRLPIIAVLHIQCK